ncbi:hypothetical protein HPB50_017900 [Hyalomma asiaticum]|uniref:Uncharacterized protein n=1 Tax=Hyalomma asiaticum TaxID=266040 RepID=A0ACB7T5G0_HYAAI|nr:hypothetical protein HPB50_017900 [Hyalomma asiaticum]
MYHVRCPDGYVALIYCWARDCVAEENEGRPWRAWLARRGFCSTGGDWACLTFVSAGVRADPWEATAAAVPPSPHEVGPRSKTSGGPPKLPDARVGRHEQPSGS